MEQSSENSRNQLPNDRGSKRKENFELMKDIFSPDVSDSKKKQIIHLATTPGNAEFLIQLAYANKDQDVSREVQQAAKKAINSTIEKFMKKNKNEQIEQLMEFIKDSDDRIPRPAREVIAQGLAQYGDVKVINPLIRMIESIWVDKSRQNEFMNKFDPKNDEDVQTIKMIESKCIDDSMQSEIVRGLGKNQREDVQIVLAKSIGREDIPEISRRWLAVGLIQDGCDEALKIVLTDLGELPAELKKAVRNDFVSFVLNERRLTLAEKIGDEQFPIEAQKVIAQAFHHYVFSLVKACRIRSEQQIDLSASIDNWFRPLILKAKDSNIDEEVRKPLVTLVSYPEVANTLKEFFTDENELFKVSQYFADKQAE